MTFRVGERVVCVDDKPERGASVWEDKSAPRVGVIYTIREVCPCYDGTPGIKLFEIKLSGNNGWNDGKPYRDLAYCASRFRPLIERKSSTDTGFSILDDIRKRESVDDAAPVKRRQRV